MSRPATTVEFLAAAYLRDWTYTHRPQSPVVHLYDGPLTASRLYVPHGRRAVCGTPSKRLHVIEETHLLLDLGAGVRRVCRGCSARLAADPSRRVELLNRDQIKQAFAAVTPWVLAMWCWAAVTPDEARQAGVIGTVVFGSKAAASTPVVAPTGRMTKTLTEHADAAVLRLDRNARAARDEKAAALAAADVERSQRELATVKAERAAVYQERQDAIARDGIQAVSPEPRRKPRRRSTH